MAELVGVTMSVLQIRVAIKRHLLLCDRIAWPHANVFVSTMQDSSFKADVQWLLDQGLIITPSLRRDGAGSPEARNSAS